ncbi:MAG TPA: DEAD/DEAH box helicase [bacterium]|nr:DEAD/DEAH box helicase [bacterium]
MRFADIAIATPVHTAFTYSVPDGLDLSQGMRVIVPFRRRSVFGICTAVHRNPSKKITADRIKAIEEVPDKAPVISPSMMKLILWMSSYYCAPIGEAFRAALPSRLIQNGGPRTTRPHEPFELESIRLPSLELTDEQRAALDTISEATATGAPSVFLLEGITGSGKTEVYIRLFEKLVSEGKQGLLMVPEIGLTPVLTGLVAARFGGRVALYHSGLTDAQRHAQWLRMAAGEVDVVVGTRSALFAPLDKLGAIVVDEEHDGSYKQDDGFAYHGRDAAVMRAHIEGIPAVLGSATPSLESLENARRGKYRLLRLSRRPTGSPLPSVEIVDMRRGGGAGKQSDGSSPKKESEGESRRREFCALSPPLYDAMVRLSRAKSRCCSSPVAAASQVRCSATGAERPSHAPTAT